MKISIYRPMAVWTCVLAVLLVWFCGTSWGRGASQETAKTVLDLSGRAVNPFTGTNVGTVLIFLAVDCPISNKYAPEIRRLRTAFEKRIAFWMVYPDADTKPSEIRQHVEAFNLGAHILRDPNHILVKKAQVTITPEAAIFDRSHHLVYHGRIDDRFASLGRERSEPTRRDLEQNLNLLVSGQPISPKATKSVGCHISDLDK